MVSLPIVLLIFLSSNSPKENLNEGIVTPPTARPEKGFVDNGKASEVYSAPVNDLTAADFKFPDDHSRGLVAPNKKIILEKLVPDEKKDKNKTPVPLYSLVKNDCGEGYALDENGVCQKTITVRSGKKLDADRRKRHVSSYERSIPRKPENGNENSIGGDPRNVPLPYSNLYPGLAPEKNGGYRKTVKSLGGPFDKTLPP